MFETINGANKNRMYGGSALQNLSYWSWPDSLTRPAANTEGLRPGQTDASPSRRKLKTWVSQALRGIALTNDDLPSVWSTTQPKSQVASCKSQVASRELFRKLLASQWYRILTAWDKVSSLEMCFFATYVYVLGNLRVCLGSQRESLQKFNLRLLATNCGSVWPRL